MTQPSTTLGRPADQDQRDDKVLAYETALQAVALAALLSAINGAVGMAMALVAAGVPATVVRAKLVAALLSAPTDVAARLRERWPTGVRLGVDHALTDVRGELPAGEPPTARGLTAAVPDEAAKLTATLDRELRVGLDRAVKLAETLPLDMVADVAAVQAKAGQTVAQAKAQIAWFAQRAVHAGTTATAKAAGAQICWIAERSACLVCLALSGEVVEPGESFDYNATYGDPMPTFPADTDDPLLGPPRHPWCRCGLRLVTGDQSARTSLPRALRREAQRAVLRGWSSYDSNPAKMRAAAKLLLHPTLLPKSVEARARRDVKRGLFTPQNSQSLPGLGRN